MLSSRFYTLVIKRQRARESYISVSSQVTQSVLHDSFDGLHKAGRNLIGCADGKPLNTRKNLKN